MKKLIMFLIAIIISGITWGQNIFFDGFETGNTDQTAIAGWTQESVTGFEVWTANSSLTNYNRTPRTGSFNAYLKYSNTRWLFKSVSLTGGVTYTFKVWARQDGSTTTNSNITLKYGSSASAASMTNTIVTATGIDATYKEIKGVFTPSISGIYYVGIMGYMNSSPWYISIDDISLDIAVLPDAAPTMFAATSITQSGMTIGWTDASTNETAFKVYRSTDNVNFTQVGSNVASTTTTGTGTTYSQAQTGLLPGVTYYYRITAVADGESPYLTGNQITLPAGEYVSNVASGNWSTAASWLKDGVVASTAPTASDNVTIADGHTIILDAAGACNILTVGGGATGILEIKGFTLTVNKNMAIASGATVKMNSTASTAGNISITGDLTNNGTLDLYASTTNYAKITFTGTTNAAFTLNSGSTTDLDGNTSSRGVNVNKGSSVSSVLDFIYNGGTLTVQGVSPVVGCFYITNGLLKISGSTTLSFPVFSSTSYSIPATGGFWLNNANATVTALAGSPTLAGLLKVSTGMYNVGTAAHNMGISSGAIMVFEGGTSTFSARFAVSTSSNITNFSQSGGIINVNNVSAGNTSTTYYSFDMGTATTSTFTMSGGNINIIRGSGASNLGGYDYRGPSTSAIINITGGTLNIGSASTVAATTYKMYGVAPTTIVDATNNPSLSLSGTTGFYGDFTFNGTGTFNNNYTSLIIKGNSISNPGNFTMPVGSTLTINTSNTQTLTFNSSFGNQTFAVNGTFTGTSSTGQLPSIVLNNTFGGAGTVTIPGGLYVMGGATLTLTKGSLNVGTGIYLGTGTTTGFTYLKGDGSITGTQNFNFGTGTVNYTYNGTTSQITGGGIPATINGTLTINNSNGVTLGNPLTVGYLTLSTGKLYTTATNLLTISNSGTASVGSATAYVDGPMARSFAASRTATGTYSTATVFPLGKGGIYLPLWIDPTTNVGGSVIFSGEAFTSNSGSMGPGVNSLSTNRWEALLINGNSNLTSSNIQFGDASILSTNKILQSTTSNGSYEAIVPIVNYTAGTPNILKTTGTQILAPVYYGYFAYGDLTPCTAPSEKAKDLITSNMTTTGFTGNFTAADDNPSNYLVVRYATGDSPSANPADYTAYTAGVALGNGTVVSANTTTTFNATGLTAGLTYDFYVYSYNNSGCYGPVYNTGSYLMATVTTCAATTGTPGTPTAASVTSIDFIANWTASSTSGVEYLLDVATDNTFTTFVSGYEAKNVGSALTDNITGLTVATTYYVRVKAVITGCNSAYTSTLTVITECNAELAPTLVQDFSTYTGTAPQPVCWKEAIGTLAASTTLTGTISEWINSTGFANAGTNKGVKVNLYSTGNDWIISNPIDLGVTPGLYRLKYDIAVTGYNATTVQSTLGTHKVDVVISTDGGATWSNTNIIKSYTGIGTYSNTGQTELVNLTSYSGIVKFAFVETTTSSSPDIDFHIDNFQIEALPACLEPSALNATAVTAISATINWTASLSSPTNGYEYEVRTSGAAGSGATGLVTTGTTAAGIVTANIGSLTANTTYSFYVRSNCGSNYSSWTSAGTFFTGYCTPAPSSVDNSGITNVSFSTINNSTGVETGNYGNYSAMIGDVQRSISVPVYITFETGYTYDTKIWVDWNDDLDFNDLGEEVYVGTSLATNPTTLTASFTVPLTATLGNHRMRIGSQDSGPAVPCYTGSYGSYEDYTINVIPAPSCLAPTLLNATSSAFQADLSWTENGTATSWDIEWGITGFTPNGTPTIAGVTNPYTLPGLSQTTEYAYYVRANCGSSYSTWTGPKTFTTTVACPAPTALTTNSTTTTTANISWTSTAGTFEIEYGISPYTFTGVANVPGGATATNKELTGLQSATTYQYKVKAICGGIYGESAWSVTGSFSTACGTMNIPYTQNFDGVTAPAIPNCMTVTDDNGILPNWATTTGGATANAMKIGYTAAGAGPLNDWFFTPSLNLTAGTTYKVTFKYKGGSSSYVEKLEVKWGAGANAAAMTSSAIFSNISFYVASYQTVNATFTPISSGMYNIGWHAFSIEDQMSIYVDDISITESQAGLWTGATNNDWATATNWDNGSVPTLTTNVTIPATATNFPTLSAATTIHNLTIESNVSGTGSLLDNSNLTLTGTATIKQYVTGNKWHIISIPVQTATANVFHLAAGQADIYIREYNAGVWSYITNLTTPLSVGKGYSIWADIGSPVVNKPNPTVSFIGQINTGNVTINMNPWIAINTGWNFIGNPYTSAIDWSLVPDKATILKNSGAAYFWNQSLNANEGAYATHDGTTPVNGATPIIPAMQGFLVQAASSSITFTNADRVHSNQQIYKSTASINDLIRITAKRGVYSDETVVILNSNATNNFDNSDAVKMFANNNNVPEVYTVATNNNLVINRFGTYPAAIPMNIRLGVSDNVTLTASEFANFDANVSIKLEDLLTGTIQDLRLNPSYTFAASIGDNANRFVLHFATALGINEPNSSNTSIYANDNTIYVNTTEQVKEINVYNMLGQVITSIAGNGKSLNTIKVDKATAYYIVKVTTDKGVRTEKVFVK